MRALVDWYFTAHPPIMHDLHEAQPLLYTYSGGPPQNPNLDPILFAELPFFSNFELAQMTKWGMPGVYTHAFMDGWSPGIEIEAVDDIAGKYFGHFISPPEKIGVQQNVGATAATRALAAGAISRRGEEARVGHAGAEEGPARRLALDGDEALALRVVERRPVARCRASRSSSTWRCRPPSSSAPISRYPSQARSISSGRQIPASASTISVSSLACCASSIQ